MLQQATRQHLGVVNLLSARNGELVHLLVESRAESANLAREAAQLRGDKVALTFELDRTKRELSGAQQTLETARAALGAEIVPLPARDELSVVGGDIWTEDGFPTVVQLQALVNPPLAHAEERKHA